MKYPHNQYHKLKVLKSSLKSRQTIITPKELENTDYRKFIITIKLADECKNGYDDAVNGVYILFCAGVISCDTA